MFDCKSFHHEKEIVYCTEITWNSVLARTLFYFIFFIFFFWGGGIYSLHNFSVHTLSMDVFSSPYCVHELFFLFQFFPFFSSLHAFLGYPLIPHHFSNGPSLNSPNLP